MAAVLLLLLLLLLLTAHDRLLNGAPCHQLRAMTRRLWLHVVFAAAAAAARRRVRRLMVMGRCSCCAFYLPHVSTQSLHHMTTSRCFL
jgi:hypothetical protein